uniref:Actin n=1 Tax=Candidozyma auris TaxID=498019 RepID=A0A0L0P4P2_CANAR
MVNLLPAVVIDNGTSTTRAGFALEDLPSLVFSLSYLVDENNNVLIGDKLNTRPDLEVMTLVDNGIVYNFEHIAKNWEYAYENLDSGNGVDSKEHPLMMTEQTWNTLKNKAATAQIAFETLEVPLFSLLKSPLAQLYHTGRSSGLVVDVGAGVASVTPIIDGVIQQKSCFHSKYAGDFANLHALRSIEAKLGYQPGQVDYNRLLPSTYNSGNVSQSFRLYYVAHNLLQNFKETMLSVSEPPPGVTSSNAYYQQAHQLPSFFQLPDRTQIHYSERESSSLLEALFVPHIYKLPDVPIPDPAFDKAHTHGISNLVLFSLKNLESTMVPAGGDPQNASNNARFNEILRQMFTNTLITGGCSLLPGFSDRVCGDISRTAPSVLPNYMITSQYKIYINPLRNYPLGDINDIFDKKFGSWLGAANLANMLNDAVEDENGSANIALDNWFISKADYEELGEDLVVEKFK